jgi:hypothetical protein
MSKIALVDGERRTVFDEERRALAYSLGAGVELTVSRVKGRAFLTLRRDDSLVEVELGDRETRMLADALDNLRAEMEDEWRRQWQADREAARPAAAAACLQI